MRLRGWRGGAALLACAMPALLGFVLPVLIMVHLHLQAGDDMTSFAFVRLAGNSLSLAALAAALTVGAALVLGYGLRRARDRWTRAAIRLATMGYAICLLYTSDAADE